MKRYHITLAILFGLFVIATTAYISRVPGFLGDEGSEGENVYQILHVKALTVEGERSYIGPFIDYVRVPFFLLLGYTPLALRVVVLLASWAIFWLLAIVLAREFGEEESLLPLTALLFSPIYLVYQRLGWAITLNVFFAVLLVFALRSTWKHKALLAGLIAGLGLHNHIIFLGTLADIAAVALAGALRRPKALLAWWPSVIGFAAGFSTQAAVLLLRTDDQGDVGAVAKVVSERWHDLPSLLPLVISGSSYIATYTGTELPPVHIFWFTAVLAVLAAIGLLFSKHKKVAWAVAAALAIHLCILVYMIDRFSLRYFVVFVLGIWFLAGIGLEAIVSYARRLWPAAGAWASVATALGLILFATVTTLIPFLRTGGSTNEFSLGNRTDNASAFLDVQSLLPCVRGLGPLFSENVHVYNRLLYFSHQYPDIQVVDEDHKKSAAFLVNYRIPDKKNQAAPGDVCPDLAHWRITSSQRL
jgi:hypothetical protein